MILILYILHKWKLDGKPFLKVSIIVGVICHYIINKKHIYKITRLRKRKYKLVFVIKGPFTYLFGY
jgi:hypothetical protein